mgnify:CR=1 FL=1
MQGDSTIYFECRHPLTHERIGTLHYTVRHVEQGWHSKMVDRLRQHFHERAEETAEVHRIACRTLWIGAAWKGRP